VTKTSIQSSVTETARTRILDAADRLLARYGFRKMTVDDIAREAGIGKGTVYLSFPSKEEIALSCIDRMVSTLLDRLRELAGGHGSADQRLRAMLRARVLDRFDYASAHAASLDALLGGVRPALLVRRREHFAAEARVFATVLREATAAGELASRNAARDAETLVTATNALLPYSLSLEELGDREGVERRLSMLSDLLVRGLVVGHRPGRARKTLTRRTPS
jgi:AcrR family transcriptional regulator